MSSTDLVTRLIAILNDWAIPYMLVGSYSSNYYGRPRATQDADFVLIISGDQLKQLSQRLGPEFKVDPQMSFETVPAPEDVVVTKLRWSKGGQRSKDIADVAEVLATQQGKLDLEYIRPWCDRHGTRELFERLLATTPPV